MDWEQTLDAVLRKVQGKINDRLARQIEQLSESLRDFLDDLFNYPLVEHWRHSLARFSEHWSDQGLVLTGRTLAALEELIAQRINGSIAVVLAEGPVSAPSPNLVGTDAVLSVAPVTRPGGSGYQTLEMTAVQERSLRSMAGAFAAREQQRLQLTDDERAHYEFYVYENLRRERIGWPLLPPPDYWLDKDFEYRQRIAAQPVMKALTYEQAQQSRKEALRAGYGSAREREQLAHQDLMEAKRKFQDEYGRAATFICPAFDGTGTLNDLSVTLYGFTGGGNAVSLGASPAPLAFRPRGRRGGPPRKQPKPIQQLRAPPPEKKPLFPAPAATERLTIRRGKDTPHPSHVRSVESEEKASRFIHTLPKEVVLLWGLKSGAHGADVVSYNLRTRIVTLWDVKWRGSPVRIRPSKTFRKDSGPLKNALKQAVDAIRASDLPASHKASAIQSLRKSTFQTRTLGAGSAKNSTFGDHK